MNEIFSRERNIRRSELIILRFVARKEVRLSGLDGHIFGLGQKWRECEGSVDWTRKPGKCSVWAPRVEEGRLASATA